MRSPFSTAIAIATGLVLLLTLLLPFPWLQEIRSILLAPTLVLGAVAALMGIINLLFAHWKKFTHSQDKDVYSVLVIFAFLATFIAGIALTPGNDQFQHVVTSIQVPVEGSLMGLLAISLAYASFRLFRQRKGVVGVVFVVSALIFLIISSGILSIGHNIPVIQQVLSVIEQLPVAGARGILLGIALGGLVAGVRILIGADRPYSG